MEIKPRILTFGTFHVTRGSLSMVLQKGNVSQMELGVGRVLFAKVACIYVLS